MTARSSVPRCVASVVTDTPYHAFRTNASRAINPATDDLGTLGGNYSNANGINQIGQVVGHQGRDVWDGRVQVLPVRPREAPDLDAAVVDHDVLSLADEPLRQTILAENIGAMAFVPDKPVVVTIGKSGVRLQFQLFFVIAGDGLVSPVNGIVDLATTSNYQEAYNEANCFHNRLNIKPKAMFAVHISAERLTQDCGL